MIISLAEKYIKSEEIFYRIKKKIKEIESFKEIVFTWNKKINLTSYNEEDFYFHAIIENFLIFEKIPLPENLLDIGTGFGNPSISLALIFPEIIVFSSEINKKKLSFLYFIKNELNIKNLIIFENKISNNHYALVTGKAFMNAERFLNFLKENNISFSNILLFVKEPFIIKNQILVRIKYTYKGKKYSQLILGKF